MPLFVWILFGISVGAVARLAFGGRTRLGCAMTLALAAAGSVAGGLLATTFGRMESPTTGWSRGLAIAGAVAALAVCQYVTRSRAPSAPSTRLPSLLRRLREKLPDGGQREESRGQDVDRQEL